MYLIIGGTGSFGSRYAKHLVDRGQRVRIFSRDELKQFELRKVLNADYRIGDIRDYDAIRDAVRGVTVVIHAAALKHVLTGEQFPQEAIKTNVLGTENVVNAAKAEGVGRLVFLSTDKACSPVNTYGATKMLAERLVVQAGYNAVRYGNVMGSRGSVLHLFNEQMQHGAFRITDRRMTRFAVTFAYAISLVETALQADPGEIIVGKPPTFRIVDLCEAFDPDARIVETGPGPGEKLHEALLTEYEAARAIDLYDHFCLRQDVGGHLQAELKAYTSADGLPMSVKEIRGMISEVL